MIVEKEYTNLANSGSVVHLKTVLRRFSHTADLRDGKIPVDGVKLDFLDVQPAIASYRRMVRDVEFDMCELAPTTYYIARAYRAVQGTAHFPHPTIPSPGRGRAGGFRYPHAQGP